MLLEKLLERLTNVLPLALQILTGGSSYLSVFFLGQSNR